MKVELINNIPYLVDGDLKKVVPYEYTKSLQWAIGEDWINVPLKDWTEILHYKFNIDLEDVKPYECLTLIHNEYKEHLNLKDKKTEYEF
jgi:hypothetical protein